MNHDILIVGGGIAGMESALTLGDMGYKVLLAEKGPSIGGTMILLSKVFPTLDCSSCISTPKMAAASHHPNIDVLTNCEVEEIEKQDGGGFHVRYRLRSTSVNDAACTGCGECEQACTVALPDEFNFDLAASRAARIPFPQAIPKKAEIRRFGESPCSAACPAGVKAHGFVSLVRAGRHEEAFRLHIEDAPLPGSLARACYAPCEDACSRSLLEGPVSIRAVKRFMTDRYYAAHPEPESAPPETVLNTKAAVVGSGPAGLSAAYHLARRGHRVTVFEASEEAGGMLRYGIPPYRLPNEVVDRDIANVTALGVEIRTGERVESIASLKERGFGAVFVAVGTYETRRLAVEGEELEGVYPCMDFLREANSGTMPRLEGKTVAVIGGGNSAIDPARMAVRLGAERVVILYRRSRQEMPAHDWEVNGALEEGVELETLKTPKRFLGRDGRLETIELLGMELGEPDDSGRRRPVPVEGSETRMPANVVVSAIGLLPATGPFDGELETGWSGTITADEETLLTSMDGVFAGGDAVSGPSMIVEAVGHGKRAAFYMDRYLRGEALAGKAFEVRLSAVEPREVLDRGAASERPAERPEELSAAERKESLAEIEGCFGEEEARRAANRCLDCGGCCECRECANVCPAGAIDFGLRPKLVEEDVESVIVSTGFRLFDPRGKAGYGYGRFPNVITAMQMDRLVSPTKPFNHVLRPSDGKQPDNIAFVLCTGSRDCTIGNELCSRVCCMYTIKQAQLIMGAVPLADITIYTIDIRAFGKGYEEFYEQAKGMGVAFVKGRVARIDQTEEQNLILHYEDIEGGSGPQEAEHDLVVLSVGLLSNPDALGLFKGGALESDAYGYVGEIAEDTSPAATSIDGVFSAGCASAIRDIPDTILHSGAASAQAAAYIEKARAGR